MWSKGTNVPLPSKGDPVCGPCLYDQACSHDKICTGACHSHAAIRPLPSSPVPPIQLPDIGEVDKALKRHHVHVIYNPNDSPITVKVGGAEVVLGPGQSVEVR